ncbi:MAG: hypothetical protein KKE44_23250 [Proteobacteria bacterium]|nr:hypothetical protein [Pseudomonadota bacterium]MBU1585653.1 hypothetical protein [Pseudomonadota bacterium]MBU2630721.1 hypothetical protein [Pseudomonadota bacterium]
MKKKLNDLIWDIAACGLPKDHDLETLRKLILLNFILGLSCFFLFPLGTMAFFQGNLLLCAMDFIMGLFVIIALGWMRKQKTPTVISYIGVLVTGLFYLFLVANGGVNQSAFVWCFTFPVMSIFLLGGQKGVMASAILILSVIVIFILGRHVPYISRYPFDLCLRFVAAYFIITLFSFVMEQARSGVQAKLTQTNIDLKKTLEEVKTLSGLLPICAQCKKIRDDKGYWNQIEGYIQKHSEAKFSHGMCPECLEELYGAEDWYKNMKKSKAK